MYLRFAALFPIALSFTLGATHAQWVQSSGPKGGTVRNLSAAGGTLFVETFNTLLLSTDRGRTWSTDTSLTCQGNVILSNGDYFCGTYSGVRKRPAAGGSGSWTQSGLENHRLTGLAELGPYLFARSYTGIFRSGDKGSVWDSLPVGGPGIGLTQMITAGGGLFAGTAGNGVLRSLDSGKTWTASAGPIATLYIDYLAATGSSLFANTPKGLYRSADRGDSWSPLPFDTANGRPLAMAGSGADLYLRTTAGWVLRSSDDGRSWTSVQVDLSGWPLTSLLLDGSDIFAATQSQLFRSPDKGNTWTPVDLMMTSISDFASLDGALFAAGGYSGAFRSRDNGATWTTVNRGILPDATVFGFAVMGKYIFAATAWFVFRSADQGETWQQFKTGFPQFPFVTSLYTSGSILYAGSDEGLFHSTDSGQTWKRTGDSLVARIWAGPMAEMGKHILVGCRYLQSKMGGIYRSSDGGLTWTRPDSGMSQIQVRAMLAKDGFVFAGLTAGAPLTGAIQPGQPVGVYRSADSGGTWAPFNNGLTETNVSSLIAINGTLVAGTRKGAFRSIDNGNSWTPIGGGEIPPILSLTVSGPYLVAGVQDGATWRLPLSQAASIQIRYGSRPGRAAKTKGLADGRAYDIRGRDASAVSWRAWKILKQRPKDD